jgi:alkaline phosphatase D
MLNKNNLTNFSSSEFTIIIVTILIYTVFLMPFKESHSLEDNLNIKYGIASGDVTKNSTIIWSKSNAQSIMNVLYNKSNNFLNNSSNIVLKTLVNSSTDFAGHMKLVDLQPNTTYYYKVWFTDLNNLSLKSDYKTGKFKTSPNDKDITKINFVIAGDLGGSTLCRQQDIGYSIFSIMKSTAPDFFVFNGDQIYADGTCNNLTNLVKNDYRYWQNIEGNFKRVNDIDWNDQDKLNKTFLRHWEYNREDPHFQNFLNETSMYSQSDDHEVIDNYGNWFFYEVSKYPNERNKSGYSNLVKTGINYFFEFSPIEKNQENPDQIYRMFQWGKNLDLFLLDVHSYRSVNTLPDTLQNNKTLYGKQQLDWLMNKLLSSNATWKIISNPIPITIPDCIGYMHACNNWATNNASNILTFTKERNQFLKFLDERNIKNIIFLTTDVHYAATVKVSQDFDRDGDLFTFYEMTNGPLSVYTIDKPYPLDPTINATYIYTESALFNFGHIKIEKEKDGKYHFIYNIIDSNNRIRPNSTINLIPN